MFFNLATPLHVLDCLHYNKHNHKLDLYLSLETPKTGVCVKCSNGE